MSIKNIAVWGVLSMIAGSTVFTVSHKVDEVRRDLRRTEREIAKERENIRVLQAEWAWLSRPERIQVLVRDLTDLRPTTPKQLASLDNVIALSIAEAPHGPTCSGLKPPSRKPTMDGRGYLLATMRRGGNDI
jgi:hypothetical protein